MNCSCEQWKDGITELDAVIFYAHIHGVDYTNPTFKYCPWCGKELTKKVKGKGKGR